MAPAFSVEQSKQPDSDAVPDHSQEKLKGRQFALYSGSSEFTKSPKNGPWGVGQSPRCSSMKRNRTPKSGSMLALRFVLAGQSQASAVNQEDGAWMILDNLV
jgi:hypothetical protein